MDATLKEMGCVKITGGPPQFVISTKDDPTHLHISIRKLAFIIELFHNKSMRFWSTDYIEQTNPITDVENKQPISRKTVPSQKKSTKSRKSKKTLKIESASSSDDDSTTDTESSSDETIIHKVSIVCVLAKKIFLKITRLLYCIRQK